MRMKFAIISEHREFFQKEHTIEFEGLFTAVQLSQLVSSIDESLADQLIVSGDELPQLSPGKLFMAGHDLWRSSPQIKKLVAQKQLAEIAAELIEQKTLRLGYDQLFPEFRGRIYKTAVSDAYHQLLNTQLTLAGISSIEGVQCGLMICLKGDGTAPADHGTVFSKIPGSGVFFHPDAPLDFHHIQQHPLHSYLLIVYARNNATYKLNEIDPHTYSLKHLGVTFGEKLSDKFNPIVYR